MSTLEQWVVIIVIVGVMAIIYSSEKLSQNQKIFGCFAVIIIFLMIYLSGPSGGSSYMEEACPDCGQL